MPELNVVALYKGDHKYLFIYDDDSREALRDSIRDTAADPAAPLNWFDAAILISRTYEIPSSPPSPIQTDSQDATSAPRFSHPA